MRATDRFRVRPTALDTEAQAATSQADTQQQLSGRITTAPPPSDAFGRVPASSRIAQWNSDAVKGFAAVVDDQTTVAKAVAQGVKNSADGYRTTDAQIAAEFDRLAKAAGAAAPQTVASGNGGGAATGAYAEQINANRDRIRTELTAEQGRLASLREQAAADPDDGRLQSLVTESRRKVDLYDDILTHGRKIVSFDPAGNGRMVEMIGDITPQTRDVLVYTPGTFARLANEQDAHDVVASFVNASPDRSLAGFVWQDGAYPQNLVTQAPDPSYSQALAPRLAAFTHDLDAQVAQHAPGANVSTTGMGWSYGGAVLGLADKAGASFDREIFVEGAGMGHGVWKPEDLQPGVTRYAMTAPLDPIQATQGTEVFGLGHGADPDHFPGNVRLDTGDFTSGWPILWQHDGWTQVHSDAWWNLYHAVTGGPVESGGDVR